jgi:hypothetical protein
VLLKVTVHAEQDALVEFCAELIPAPMVTAGDVEVLSAIRVVKRKRGNASVVAAALAAASFVLDHSPLEDLTETAPSETRPIRTARVASALRMAATIVIDVLPVACFARQ